jgi:hypothetical protein
LGGFVFTKFEVLWEFSYVLYVPIEELTALDTQIAWLGAAGNKVGSSGFNKICMVIHVLLAGLLTI